MDTELQSRLSRAEQLDPDVFVLDDDPFVIEIESTTSDSNYTIVPNVAYCSCPDRAYRQVPCKHILYLATSPDVNAEVRESAVSGIEHELDEIYSEMHELSERLDTLQERESVWVDATLAVTTNPDHVSVPDEILGKIDDGILGAEPDESPPDWSTDEPETSSKALGQRSGKGYAISQIAETVESVTDGTVADDR